MIGTQLGHYRLTGLLGEGGMGRVFAAEDLRLGRRVALKLLPESLQGLPEHVERFQREARLLAAVNHPNVITVHSVEEADGKAFITMELVEGGTLLDRIRPGGLPLGELLDVAIPLAQALAAAHAMGIVHRDLKPANVMIGRDGRLKVVDFGIAKPDRAAADGAAPLTGAGLVLGTPAYMAPEQLQGDAIDQRADLFALGVLIHELATGTRPFAGRCDADVVSAILRDPPPPLRRQRGDLPEALQDLVGVCLQKDPARRSESAAAVARALESLRRPSGSYAAVERERPPLSALAVLPLQELGAASDDLLADGLTEALIADLARASGLKVISRSSVMRFRDSELPLPEIAGKLGVDALVTGSVRRSGNRIRVTVELIEADSERVLWADRYDRELEDVLRLQDEIARAVADGVHARVSQGAGGERASPTPRKVDPEVYMLDLKGRGQIEVRTPGSFRASLTHFREALARDPSYGPSWVGIVRARNMQLNYGLEEPDAVRPEMEDALARAAECGADAAEVLAERAQLRWQCDYDWVGAEADFCRALELAPNNARVWYWRGIAAGSGGNRAASFEYLDRAESLDPLSYFIRAARGLMLYFADRVPEAIKCVREVLELSPDLVSGYWILGMALAAAGEYPESIQNSESAARFMARMGRTLSYLGFAYARSGREQDARAVLEELQGRPGHYVPAYFSAVVLCGLGDKEGALARLELALAQHDSMLRDLRVDPALSMLRGEPRFLALQENMRFPVDISGPTRVNRS